MCLARARPLFSPVCPGPHRLGVSAGFFLSAGAQSPVRACEGVSTRGGAEVRHSRRGNGVRRSCPQRQGTAATHRPRQSPATFRKPLPTSPE